MLRCIRIRRELDHPEPAGSGEKPRARSSVRIASVSIEFPSASNPRRGLFVQRRLLALARIAEVCVVHPQPWFPWLRPVAPSTLEAEAGDGLPVVRPRMFYIPGVLKGLDGNWVRRAILPTLRALEAGGGLDLLDAHFGYPEGVGAVLAARELDRPVFITMRGLERPVLTQPWRGRQLSWALQECTGIVSVSYSLKDLALEHGVPESQIEVIPNAVDRALFHPGDQAEARRRLGLNQKDRLVVCVGMLIAGKGQHHLVEAAGRLRNRIPQLRLALIGGVAHEPRYPAYLERRIRDLGVSDMVQLLGSQAPATIATWLQAADVFALPTYDEGCCNAILEALACGVPVVTTTAGDNRLLVDPPNRGRVVPIGDPDSFTEALEEALTIEWDRTAIAAAGVAYSWDEVARKTLEFFHRRLAASRRNRAGGSGCSLPEAPGAPAQPQAIRHGARPGS